MYARAARAYKQVDLESAPKPQILDRLYTRLLRDLDEGSAAIAARDVKARAAAFDHALRIVTELKAALDHDIAPELCGNLSALYSYVEDQVGAAAVQMSQEPVELAVAVIVNLQSAFREAASQNQ